MKEIVHFIGLGGIGMSALARILLQKGVQVQGSDLRTTPLLEELEREGALVKIGHSANGCESATTIVYSSGIQSENVEFVRAKELRVPLLHRSELLSQLMRGKKPLMVTGTHGKTTVTALLSSVLDEAGLEPSFVIGGIHQKWKTNGKSNKGEYFVAEADESDGSFLNGAAFGAIVTNLENDHLDYWKDPAALDGAFRQFFQQALHEKHLFWCGDDARLQQFAKGVSYGFGVQNELRIASFEALDSGIRFDVQWQGKRYEKIDLQLFGRHNALNGAAVFGLALSLGIPEMAVRRAFAAFAGIARRLELKGSSHGVDVYDDYGHHPTEIIATLNALRGKVRERRLIAVFQPHRFTRVRDLFDSFLACLGEADIVAMTDIYSAGEPAIEGVSSAALYAKIREKLGHKVMFFPRAHLEEGVAQLLCPHDVVVTLGAGDVTKAGSGILQRLSARSPKLTIGVLFGGTSSEHDVSLMSARTIIEGLNASLYEALPFGLTKNGEWLCGKDALEKLERKMELTPGTPKISPEIISELTRCDAVIPVFHGQQGEDGMIQGFLDTLDIPYAGCDYRSSAICMHKGWTKHVARIFGVPTSPYIEFDRGSYRKTPEALLAKIEEELTFPIWIKPVHLGSSIGVSRVATKEEVAEAAAAVFALDDTLIAENEIAGREIEFSLLGNEYLRVAPIGEVLKQEKFHSYESKYGAAASPFEIPADLTPTEQGLGEELAREMYLRAGCQGLARIDFFLDNHGHFWFNEINPLPGFTKTSAYPEMWKKGGMPIDKICDQLVILALHKHRRLSEIRGK